MSHSRQVGQKSVTATNGMIVGECECKAISTLNFYSETYAWKVDWSGNQPLLATSKNNNIYVNS
jgi:hypothetical protein